MKMTMNEIQQLDHPVDKLMLVSICGMSYQLYAHDKGERFAVYDNKGKRVVSNSLEAGKILVRKLKCKSAVLYQQLPYDEACVSVEGEMSPVMEIPIDIH
ncbi:DUF6482 family protein [Pseudomonas sp. HK3]|jgi:hypothetical protein